MIGWWSKKQQSDQSTVGLCNPFKMMIVVDTTEISRITMEILQIFGQICRDLLLMNCVNLEMFLLMIFCRVAKHYFVEHLHSHGANAPKLAALKAPSPRASFLRSEPMTQNKNHHPESKTQSTDAQASVEEQELQGLLETQSAYSVASMQSAVELWSQTEQHELQKHSEPSHWWFWQQWSQTCLRMPDEPYRPNVVQQ